MPNPLNVQISVNSTVDNVTSNLRSSVSTNTTSSNVIIQSVTVTGSVWTALSLGTLSDVRNVFVWNDNTTYSASVIQIAQGSAGQNPMATLWSGDGANIPWSGSFISSSLYAKVLTGIPNVNGLVQYSAQQS